MSAATTMRRSTPGRRGVTAWAEGTEPADAERVGGPAPAQRRDVFVYFDNDAKVRAPADAAGLAQRVRPPPATP